MMMQLGREERLRGRRGQLFTMRLRPEPGPGPGPGTHAWERRVEIGKSENRVAIWVGNRKTDTWASPAGTITTATQRTRKTNESKEPQSPDFFYFLWKHELGLGEKK